MKKIFVVTDNKFMYEAFKKLANNRNINFDYYCSPKSQSLFNTEIENNRIIPLYLKDNESAILDKNYDLGISCHSRQLFPKKLVQSITCINIHPGLNPYNRGWFPQVFSIINGLPIGATIHIMDEPGLCNRKKPMIDYV